LFFSLLIDGDPANAGEKRTTQCLAELPEDPSGRKASGARDRLLD
jgi:hypothetical protein